MLFLLEEKRRISEAMWRFMRSNFTAGLVSGVMFTLLLMFLLDRFYGDFSAVRYHGDPILLPSQVSVGTYSKSSANNTDDVKIEHPVVKNEIIRIPGLLYQETQNKQGMSLLPSHYDIIITTLLLLLSFS